MSNNNGVFYQDDIMLAKDIFERQISLVSLITQLL